MRIQNGYKRIAINKGTTILFAQPFAYILTSLLRNERCDHCLRSGKLFKCSGCQYVHYCDRTCQKESWTVHKTECPNLKKIFPRIMPDAARLMARIIINLGQGGADERGYYTETSYRKFKDLMSHYSDVKKDTKRMEHFTSLCGVLFEFLNNDSIPNTAELMGIYGRVCVNSFNILDPDMNSIGVGIYLAPSIIDHSCNPNAVAVFEGTTIIIRTIEDLPCLDWSQVKISYIDLLKSTENRRAELQSAYYFLCTCSRCKEPETMGAAAACPNSTCSYPCSPESNACPECKTKFPMAFNERFTEITELTSHHLEDMKNMAYLDVSKMCLKKQEGILHSFNIQHVRTLEAAFDASLILNCWEDAEFFANKLIPGYLLYYGELHPLTGLLYLMMGKIQLHNMKPKDALDVLTKANKILAITHGERHSLIKEHLLPLLQQATVEGFS